MRPGKAGRAGRRGATPGVPLTVEVVDRRRGGTRGARAVGAFLERLGTLVPSPPGSHVVLCLLSDGAMRKLNRTFRGRRGTTDVLAFPGEGTLDPEGKIHLGEIALSIPRAARQARDEGHPFARELRILALHGYLHLLGHDHESDQGEMMRMQGRLIRKLLPARSRGRG